MTNAWLYLILHIFIGSTLAGSAVVAALTMGYTTSTAILVTALLGFLVAFPVTWFVTRQIIANT